MSEDDIWNERLKLFAIYLNNLAVALERLGGRYITAEDVGTSPADMAHIATKTKYVAGLGASGDPSPFTALGCFVGAQAAVKHYLGRDSLEGLTVAVQGLGNVGYDYARRLHAAGAKLIVTDIDQVVPVLVTLLVP